MVTVQLKKGSKKYEALKKLVEELGENPARVTWIQLVTLLMGAGLSLSYAERIAVELRIAGVVKRKGDIYEIDLDAIKRVLEAAK